jgi:hypothetical protein
MLTRGGDARPSSIEMTWHSAVCLAVLALPAAAQDGAARIQTEIRRVQQSLKDRPISDPRFPDMNANSEQGLKAAGEALSAGRTFLGLERMGQTTGTLQGVRWMIDRTDAVSRGAMAAFETEWGKASANLAAIDQEVGRKSWAGAPLAVRALSETARVRTTPLMEGSRGFALATGPGDGLFYIGQALAEAEFAQFCAKLNLERRGKAYPLRSLVSELGRLQEKTNAAFQPPKSIELHPRFIALNAALKTARELDAARFYAGALYQYLEAVRHYGMLDVPEPDEPSKAALRESVAALGRKLAASKDDDSIAQLFAERAASQVVHADGSAPAKDEWRSARTIVEQVMPMYYAARKPASGTRRAPGKTIEITLVRWPYT